MSAKMSAPGAVIVEADGASRGNPGPASYGALLRDAATGQVIAEAADTLGVATNNAAEYEALIAGLGLVAEHAPQASVEVRMDSKLVVEQMRGTWKIKHADLRERATRARELLPAAIEFTWIPREQNSAADQLANQALDGEPTALAAVQPSIQERARGWSEDSTITTLVLVRHGVTKLTSEKRFSGGLEGSNPPLNDEGRDQIRSVAEWLAPGGSAFDAIVASPVHRTRESADIIAERLEMPVVEEPRLAEMNFGRWDGRTFDEVGVEDEEALAEWLGSVDAVAGGTGESTRQVQRRSIEAVGRIEEDFAGQTVVVVAHATPIKALLAYGLGAPLEAVNSIEVKAGSVSVLAVRRQSEDDTPGPPRGTVRLLGALPPARSHFAEGSSRW